MKYVGKCIFLIALGLSLRTLAHDHLNETLKKISYKEHLYLENFFRILICSEGLGYTLFFDKPVCLSGYFIKEPLGNVLRGGNNSLFKRGWFAWKKNEFLFPHPNFLIFDERLESDELENYERETGEKVELHSIFIINKRVLICALEKHLELFKKELGDEEFTPQRFIAQLEEAKSFYKAIHFHEGLLGILLGYGVESAMHYHEREMGNVSQESSLLAIGNMPKKTSPCFIKPMQFAGNPHSIEVQEIVKKNWLQQKQLCKIYAKNNFFEVSLKQLMLNN